MRLKVHTKATLSDAMTALEKANREVAYQAALEGIVLLENDGCLPVKPGKIALFGAGAGMTIKGGTGSGEVNERHAVSIREGLEMSGFTVTTGEWIDEYARLYEAGEKAYAEAFHVPYVDADILCNLCGWFLYNDRSDLYDHDSYRITRMSGTSVGNKDIWKEKLAADPQRNHGIRICDDVYRTGKQQCIPAYDQCDHWIWKLCCKCQHRYAFRLYRIW